MTIVKDEDTLSTIVAGGNRLLLIPPEHIIGNPVFRHFQQLFERATIADISFTDCGDKATVTLTSVSMVNFALFTQLYQNLEEMWVGVFKDKPLVFTCVFESSSPHNALIKPVYVVEDAQFEFAPRRRIVILTGSTVFPNHSNAYELKKHIRKLISMRETSDHEFSELVKSYENETEETHNG